MSLHVQQKLKAKDMPLQLIRFAALAAHWIKMYVIACLVNVDKNWVIGIIFFHKPISLQKKLIVSIAILEHKLLSLSNWLSRNKLIVKLVIQYSLFASLNLSNLFFIIAFVAHSRFVDQTLNLMLRGNWLIWEQLCDVGMPSWVIDHIKKRNQGVLLCVAEGAIIDEMVAPDIVMGESWQINCFSKQDLNQFCLSQQ